MKGVIKAICLSKKRGTAKEPVAKAKLVAGFGLEGDAHAGSWHRQVSLLSAEQVADFNARGGQADPGDFGENLLVSGIDFAALPVGTRFLGEGKEIKLRLTQIGKDCHSHCEIFRRVGDCIMPRQGVFAVVEQGGELEVGQELEVVLPTGQEPLTAAVITLSDKGYAGERVDTAGPKAAAMLKAAGYEIIEEVLLPDEQPRIEKELKRLADQRQVDLIITTGGTGFSVRDCTPEATLAVATRNVPGIAEAIRAGSMQYTPRAMLGRGASVLRNMTLIVNLPGSTKAVAESLELVLPQLEHGLKILKGSASECGR